MKQLSELLGKKILFLDGGSGSILQGWGLKPGELPESWNISNTEKIEKLAYSYYSAGSNIVYTNTFGAYKTKFGLNLKQIVEGAVTCAKKAREKWQADCREKGIEPQECFVALDIGPCGKLLKPMGDLDFEDAVDLFKTTILYGLKCDVDCVVIETMNDAYETKAAVLAAKEAMEELKIKIPLLVTNVYDLECHLLTGANPEAMAAILEGLGVDAFGLNCSLGPKEMLEPVKRLVQAASLPVIVKPNAGLPRDENGKTVFDVGPEDFASAMLEIAKEGACILGGCCGTTPDHIRKLKEAVISLAGKELTLIKPITENERTVVASYTHTVQIGGGAVPVLIGERINPTGKKKFKEALRQKDIPYIIHQGLEQEEAGAHVLDVNVGLPEIDEKEMMVRVMTELQGVTNLPLQIDTSSPEVMEAALRRYNGKALVNSVNGKQHIMDAVFPLVKKYGGVVVGLTIDEDGIPETTEGRVKIAKKIYENAEKWGIKRKDVIIDSLTMAVSSDTNAAKATLETLRIVRDELGGSSVLGVSNISFGLPNREFVTSAFFTLAMHNGLGAAIMNPLSSEMMKAWNTYVLLNGQDKDCLGYLKFSEKYDQKKAEADEKAALSGVQGAINAIYGAFPSSGQVNPALAAAGKFACGQSSAQVTASASSTSGKAAEKADSERASGDAGRAGAGSLEHAVIHGLKDDAAKITQQLLDSGKAAVEIIDGYLIPGLDYVGKKFEEKKMYLPQLLMAADSAKSAFDVIKAFLEKTGQKGKPKGTCIVATVHGDIHDIGKNIVKVLLENYDFEVIDLGKDVPPETVVEACKKDHVELVGLSALMTTTVPAMKETIEQLRKECPWAKCCVGGAVMTQEYADSIGADFYGKDAMDTVKYAQKVFGVV
ncbi:MAG: homocysteine S-methyltransferase family protein [Treponema sp.]|nr:homocysteine S-methyltransferase family protein [Treponema sp.]